MHQLGNMWRSPFTKDPHSKVYPSELVQHHEAFLMPKKLTYDMLQGLVLSSHANFVHGDWDAEEVKQYLYSLSINKDAIQSVLKHAQNARAIKLLEDDPNNNMHHQVLLCHCDSNPELYECWAYPTAWMRGLPLHAHVDVPMHLLFLCITKTVVK
jgi:hypothetical protein